MGGARGASRRRLKASFTIPCQGFRRLPRLGVFMDRVPMPSYLISLAGAAVAGALVIGSAAAAPGAGAPIEVLVDHAKVMHIARPADIVIIGNPGIADATIQDSQTLIIT